MDSSNSLSLKQPTSTSDISQDDLKQIVEAVLKQLLDEGMLNKYMTVPDSEIRSKQTTCNKEVRFDVSKGATSKESSVPELNLVDLKWGKLFDSSGGPTARLDQLLRGLGNYIIEAFMPEKSLVITPSKMVAYYSDYSLHEELFPFVFQEKNYKYPTIPALTPGGFASWVTVWIRAYPDQEALRLKDVVRNLPIDADGHTVHEKPERLPKQISRHLLPSKEDKMARKLVDRAMQDFLEVCMPRASTSLARPPPAYNLGPTKREKLPHGNILSEQLTASGSQHDDRTFPARGSQTSSFYAGGRYSNLPSSFERNNLQPMQLNPLEAPACKNPRMAERYAGASNTHRYSNLHKSDNYNKRESNRRTWNGS